MRLVILTALLVGATLTVPVVVRADDHHDKRFYDRDGHDYHTWDGQEDRAYVFISGSSTANIVSSDEPRMPSRGNTSGGFTTTRITCFSISRSSRPVHLSIRSAGHCAGATLPPV